MLKDWWCIEANFLFNRYSSRGWQTTWSIARFAIHWAGTYLATALTGRITLRSIGQHTGTEQYGNLIGRRTTGDCQVVSGKGVCCQYLFQLDECSDDVVANRSEENELRVPIAQVQLHWPLQSGQLALDESPGFLANSADLLWRCPGHLPQTGNTLCGLRLSMLNVLISSVEETGHWTDKEIGRISNKPFTHSLQLTVNIFARIV